MPNPTKTETQITKYSGLTLDAATTEKLKQTAAAELLSFEKNADGTYTIQVKYPEMGRFNGKDFHIRENINYFLRGLIRSCTDEDGLVDLYRAYRTEEKMEDLLEKGAVTEEFMEACGFSAERKDDFETFLRACKEPLLDMLGQFFKEKKDLQRYQHSMNSLMGKIRTGTVGDSDAIAYDYVVKSYDDYRNILDHYSRIRSADPKTEKAILAGMENEDFAAVYGRFLEFHNAYREANNLETIHAESYTTQLQNRTDWKNRSYLKWNALSCLLVETKVGDQKVLLSLEAKSASKEELLSCPEKVRTGIGLYQDKDEVKFVHNNVPYFDASPENLAVLNALKSVEVEDMIQDKKLYPTGEFRVLALAVEDKARIVNMSGRTEDGSVGERWVDVTHQPLFPHEPTMEDLEDSGLEHDEIKFALSGLLDLGSEAMKNCIEDNMDGTVTVRFFQQKLNEETGESLGFLPVYVTVDKKLPAENAEGGCLWAKLMEQAYLASGFGLTASRFAEPVPSFDFLEEEYQRLAKLPQEELPSHAQCPWLIDNLGKLHRWDPSCLNAVSGKGKKVLDHMLGEAHRMEVDPSEKRGDAHLVGNTMAHYGRELTRIMRGLDTTGRDSEAFSHLYKELSAFIEKDTLSSFHGDSLKKIGGNSDIKDLKNACDLYLIHCEEKRRNWSARRNNRIRLTQNLKKIITAMEKGYKDPKDELVEGMFRKMMDKNKAYHDLSGAEKERNIRRLLESKEFMHWKKSMTFEKMTELSERPVTEIMKSYKKVVVEYFMKEENMHLNEVQRVKAEDLQEQQARAGAQEAQMRM